MNKIKDNKFYTNLRQPYPYKTRTGKKWKELGLKDAEYLRQDLPFRVMSYETGDVFGEYNTLSAAKRGLVEILNDDKMMGFKHYMDTPYYIARVNEDGDYVAIK